jgi:polyhydroxyalkanoate synthesis regulator phasin
LQTIFMSSPLVHAFFVGRALAAAVYEQAEYVITDALSELGKFDAEQRERLRQFTEQVLERAQQEEEAAMVGRSAGFTTASAPSSSSADLQAMLDELRAEVAQLRSALKQYRSS